MFLIPKVPTNTPDGEVALTTPLHSPTLLEPTLSHAILPLKYAVTSAQIEVSVSPRWTPFLVATE